MGVRGSKDKHDCLWFFSGEAMLSSCLSRAYALAHRPAPWSGKFAGRLQIATRKGCHALELSACESSNTATAAMPMATGMTETLGAGNFHCLSVEGFFKNKVFYGNATEVIRDAIRRMQGEDSRISDWQAAIKLGDGQLDRGVVGCNLPRPRLKYGLTRRQKRQRRWAIRLVQVGNARRVSRRATRENHRRTMMSNFMIQGAYSPSATSSMVKNPQDRAIAVRAMIEKAGGKQHGFWFALGEYDFVAIAEFSDNVSAAAFSMAVGTSGAMSSYKTTLLFSSEESVQAMKQAAEIGYQPPK
jgi:uncharacterized protein with GYD domain